MITEKNTYETTGWGLYGNASETYFVNKHGVMFCVQSPDLVNVTTDATIIDDNRLPVDCVQLGTGDREDIEIPEWCFTFKRDTQMCLDCGKRPATQRQPYRAVWLCDECFEIDMRPKD